MTTDINNNIWVCHYRGACLSVYDLKGNKIHQIYLPVKNVTNCTFGGIKNDQLFIRNSLTGAIQCKPNRKKVSLNDQLHTNE